jgi:hypothetical protein
MATGQTSELSLGTPVGRLDMPAGGAPLPIPRPSSFLQRRVVELALGTAETLEAGLLVTCRLEEVAEGPTARHEFERIEGL